MFDSNFVQNDFLYQYGEYKSSLNPPTQLVFISLNTLSCKQKIKVTAKLTSEDKI